MRMSFINHHKKSERWIGEAEAWRQKPPLMSGTKTGDRINFLNEEWAD